MDRDRWRFLLIAIYLWRKAKRYRNTNENQTRRNKRRFWVRPIFLRRRELGAGNTLIEEMRYNPENMHYNFFRMNADVFDRLLSLIGPHIAKSDLGREPINPQTRLAITLRYLASGDSMASLQYIFRVGKSTVSDIISETLDTIWKILQPQVLKTPDEEYFRQVADGFKRSWDYPNCIGAIDGKHVMIQAPPHSGSSNYNYKGSHSTILMAVVNHQYEFIMVDIGAEGRQSDGGVFRNSLIGKKLNDGTLNIPPPKVISEGRPSLPFVIVGDEAFPLLENLMRPYPGRSDYDLEKTIYNYRHSRARRVSENAFGILVARWRIFSGPIIAKTENVDNIIKATVCLHNFLIKYNKPNYITSTLAHRERDGTVLNRASTGAATQLISVGPIGSNTFTRNARDIRDEFKSNFFEEGAVPWQWNNI